MVPLLSSRWGAAVRSNPRGFTLVELVIIILLVSVLASTAVIKLSGSLETAKVEATKAELEAIAYAIAGDPSLYQSESRVDFGYIGDVGAFPPNLDALLANPGGYTTWDGPYLASNGAADATNDGWGANYMYLDTLIRSTGSGSNIDRALGNSASQLLDNSLVGTVVDADNTIPGSVMNESLLVVLRYPNGAGGIALDSVRPSRTGNFSFSGLPVGTHQLRVVFIPRTDTITVPVTIYPGRRATVPIVFPADLW